MQHWEEIWSFRTKRFKVALDATPECDVDLSWDEDGEVREKINADVYSVVTFRVRVLLDGNEISADYLGNSIYENVRDFRDHIGLAAKSRKDGRRYGSYFIDMVHEAISEARDTLRKTPRVRGSK
jgi:hypothetical protein